MSDLSQEQTQQNPRNLEKKKKTAKNEQIASLIFLPVCESPSTEFLGTQASFKMKMRVISQALEIKCAIYTWAQGN